VTGATHSMASLVAALKQFKSESWEYEETLDLSFDVPAEKEMCCLVEKDAEGEQNTRVCLFIDRGISARVTNIIPLKVGSLSIDEYNATLLNFYDQCIKPLSEELGLKCDLWDDKADISRWVTEDAARKLKSFSSLANKSTGSSHPLDQERWFSFITAVHGDQSELGEDILIRYLREEHGWSEERAYKLGIEFEFAMDLLRYYDRNRA
jgi:hypothetical protein